MKGLKIGFTLVAMLVMVAFTHAQTADKESTEQRTERYSKALGLDNEQAEKARVLNVKYVDLINNAATPEEKKKHIGEHQLKVQELLTEEQYIKYKEMVAKENRQNAAIQKQRPAR